MEALRSIDQQQQALTKHAQLTYQAAGFSHVHKTHFDHYKQRVISIFRTANSSMKASERELGFKLSLMSSSTSLLCSLPRKWSYGQNKSLRMHKNIQELRNPTLCWQMHANANYIRAFPVFVADFATTFTVTSFSKLDSVKKIDCCRNSTVHQISDSITRSDAPDFQSACLDSPWPCQGPVTSVVIGSLSQTAQVAKTAETTRNNKQNKQKLKMHCLKSSAHLLISSSHAGNHLRSQKYPCFYANSKN